MNFLFLQSGIQITHQAYLQEHHAEDEDRIDKKNKEDAKDQFGEIVGESKSRETIRLCQIITIAMKYSTLMLLNGIEWCY